jgi:HEAT repeat protein
MQVNNREMQKRALDAVKSFRVIVSESYGELKGKSLPFKDVAVEVLNRAGFQVVEGEGTVDATLRIDVKGKALSNTFSYMGKSYTAFNRAQIDGEIIFQAATPLGSRGFRDFGGIATDNVWLTQGRLASYETPGQAPFYDAFIRASFSSKLIEMVGSIWGVERIERIAESDHRGIRIPTQPGFSGISIAEWATEVLEQKGRVRATDKLVANLQDKDPSVRRRAVKTLVKIPDVKALEPLIAALQDEDGEVRWDAAKALGNLKDSRSVEPLIAALKDTYWAVQEEAMNALSAVRDPRAIQPLIDFIKQRGSSTWNAMQALARFGDASVEPLIATINNDVPRVRADVIWVLGSIRNSRAVDPLINALKDKDRFVRKCAAEALMRIKDVKALAPLIAVLENRDEDSEVRGKAADALGELKNPRAVEPLTVVLGDKSWSYRFMAASALGRIKDSRAVEPLIGTLDDKEVVLSAETALENITGQKIGKDPKKWQEWWEKNKLK